MFIVRAWEHGGRHQLALKQAPPMSEVGAGSRGTSGPGFKIQGVPNVEVAAGKHADFSHSEGFMQQHIATVSSWVGIRVLRCG